jgi:hypothetical protein
MDVDYLLPLQNAQNRADRRSRSVWLGLRRTIRIWKALCDGFDGFWKYCVRWLDALRRLLLAIPSDEDLSLAPIPKYDETCRYIRDPDGYIIEVGRSTDLTYG